MKLKHKDQVIANVKVAKSLYWRTRGLMFRSHWDKDTTLWIHRCNSIHTMFVWFPIDVVFVDKNLVVKKIIENLPAWRMIFPVMSAQSVFEFVSGHKKVAHIKIGDQLHVGH